MLHLVTGFDRVSVSAALEQELCDAVMRQEAGQILIVPEQFSHEAERRLAVTAGDTVSRYGEVLSFSRLADRVFASFGGGARNYLDHGGRVLAMALAAEKAASRVRQFAAGLRRPEFLVELLTLADEFAGYDVQPETLLTASRRAEGQFAGKLEELALLYESYMAVCAAGSADPAEKLSRLRDILPDSGWAEGKTFYVEGFSDFTGLERELLGQLMTEGADLWVGLTTGDRESAMTKPPRETAGSLRRMAAERNVTVSVHETCLPTGREPAVEQLIRAMFSPGRETVPASDALFLGRFDTVEEECRHSVRRVCELAARGVRFRDIHIACTDLAAYRPVLEAAFRKADIPCYISGETDLLSLPVPAGVLGALTAATGRLDYSEVSRWLKSGLAPAQQEQCDRLDSYGFLWNLRGEQWNRPLEFHPEGFGLEWKERHQTALAQLEQTRQEAMSSLLLLREELRGAANTGEMVLAVHKFLEAIGLRQRLEEQAAEHTAAGRGRTAQELSQIYEALVTALEQTWLILGKTVRSPEDFCRLYRLLLTQYRIGTIPAGLDQVHISSLPDLRQRQADHVLVLGVTDGTFPAYRTGEGLLSEEERQRLLAEGISLAPSRADQMDREISGIHGALSAAGRSLWLSYAGDQPAWLLRKAAEAYAGGIVTDHGEAVLNVTEFASARVRHGDTTPMELPGLDRLEDGLRQLREYRFTPLSEETVERLYGKNIYLSASRIDKFAACRLSFFLTYGLKAKADRRAKLDPASYGTMVHDILEHTVNRVMEQGGFRQVAEDVLLDIALDEMERYVAEKFPRQDQRAAWLLTRSRREVLEIVRDLGQELRVSDFAPAACELKFGHDGQLPPITVDGKKARCVITGLVDRVDLYEEQGKTYVRVVDYKTGFKEFDYTDILCGAGLQMLIYLFALRQYGSEFFKKDSLQPAGVLYMPARKVHIPTEPLPSDEAVEKAHAKNQRRKGLILDENAVLAAMEEDPDAPRYMPYTVKKEERSGDLASAEQMELLERHVLRKLAQITDEISSGDVTPDPVDRTMHHSCTYCDFADVCHWDLCPHETRILAATPRELFWEKLTQEEAEHG